MDDEAGMTEFNLKNLRTIYGNVLRCGYQPMDLRSFAGEMPGRDRIIINRVDIDFDVEWAMILARMFSELAIPATFFVRLHGEYNPFSLKNYPVLRAIAERFEVGLHAESIDQEFLWNESSYTNFTRDIAVLGQLVAFKNVRGSASHNGGTGRNNLDFWKNHTPEQFGLLYHAYEPRFMGGVYVSDSEWTQWKSYRNGELLEGNRKSPSDWAREGEPLIYMLIHPETYSGKDYSDVIQREAA